MRRHCWPAYRRYLQRSSRPILIGPWRGETGFEILYWVPFLHALGIDPARLFVVTRGGSHCWYPAQQGAELFALRDPRDVRVENIRQSRATGELKQRHVTAFDAAVLNDAAKVLGLKRYHVLHPAWMFALLQSFWTTKVGMGGMEQPLTFTKLPAPPLPEGLTLPPHFVAARFYLRHTFPNCEPVRTVAQETVTQLAQTQPVIVLSPSLHVDDHADLVLKAGPNVIRLTDLYPGLTPQNNLAVQSAILARAEGFVGTYGGFAQLALRYGKPSISFYTEWSGTALAHKHLADALAVSMNVPAIVLKLTEIPLLRAVLPNVQFTSLSTGTPTT